MLCVCQRAQRIRSGLCNALCLMHRKWKYSSVYENTKRLSRKRRIIVYSDFLHCHRVSYGFVVAADVVSFSTAAATLIFESVANVRVCAQSRPNCSTLTISQRQYILAECWIKLESVWKIYLHFLLIIFIFLRLYETNKNSGFSKYLMQSRLLSTTVRQSCKTKRFAIISILENEHIHASMRCDLWCSWRSTLYTGMSHHFVGSLTAEPIMCVSFRIDDMCHTMSNTVRQVLCITALFLPSAHIMWRLLRALR